MTGQHDLFGDDPTRTLVRRDGHDTSVWAAEHIVKKLPLLQSQVYAFFMKHRRASLRDVEKYFNDSGSTYRTRVKELVAKGLLRAARDSTGKEMRVYQDGGWRTVWELAE